MSGSEPWLLWRCCGGFIESGAKHPQPGLDRAGRDLAIFGAIFTLAALVINLPQKFSGLMLLQPMRAFHLIYICFFVIVGGLLADYVLKNKAWRWLALFLLLCGGMWFKQHEIFSSSHHLELPGRGPSNDWDGRPSAGSGKTRRPSAYSPSIQSIWISQAKISTVSGPSPSGQCWLTA